MASAITKFGASFVLDVLYGQRQVPPPSYFIALLTRAPADTTDGASLLEPPVESGYNRIEIANDALNFGQAAGGVSMTLSAIIYPTATADWPVVSHYALCDALVDGNVYLYGAFSVPRRVSNGDQARIPAQLLNLTVTSLTTSLTSTF